MSLATAVAAFADTTGQSSYPGGGQFQNMLQNEFIQALASASNQTAAQIQLDMTNNNQTVAQIAQQLAQAGTITQQSLATAILQEQANNLAQALISGQMSGGQGSYGQSGNSQYSGQRQNGGQGAGQGNDMLDRPWPAPAGRRPPRSSRM